MERVDTMKKLQGWSDTSVRHFRNLAVYGEQSCCRCATARGVTSTMAHTRRLDPLVASCDPDYIYAYRAVSGVDLTADVTVRRISRCATRNHRCC